MFSLDALSPHICLTEWRQGADQRGEATAEEREETAEEKQREKRWQGFTGKWEREEACQFSFSSFPAPNTTHNTERCHIKHICIYFSLGRLLCSEHQMLAADSELQIIFVKEMFFLTSIRYCVLFLPQFLQQCLLQFLYLHQKLSLLRVKQSWRLSGELGKRLTGPPSRARREMWDSRPPRANLKHLLVSCSQVL